MAKQYVHTLNFEHSDDGSVRYAVRLPGRGIAKVRYIEPGTLWWEVALGIVAGLKMEKALRLIDEKLGTD